MIGAGIKAALHRLGETAYLLSPQGEVAFPASVQPALKFQGEESSPLGAGRSGQAVLYAPADSAARHLKAEDRIRAGEFLYRVLQVETRGLKGTPLYIWASLQRWEVAQ